MSSTPETPEHAFHAPADVSALRIAHVYAEALLNAAAKRGQADAILEELDSLVRDVFQADPHVESFLATPAVPQHAKQALIDKVFGARADELFTNFLNVLNAHGRLELLRPIRAAYRELLDQRARRVRVRVGSAVPLQEDQRRRLEQELREVFHVEPVLEERVDPDLLGGLTVKIGDWQYDASLRTQILNIRNQVLARSSHEIQRRRDHFGH
jgi:F-type H+-transporting ATPase subunit delta